MYTTEQLQALAASLEDDFYEVEVSEHNGRKHVLVTHDNEHAMRITPNYSHDGIKEYLLRYDCTLIPPQGEQVEAEYDDMDDLRTALENQQEIDPDAAVADFVKQVDTMLDSDEWRLGSSLDDVVAGWEPSDFDENRPRGRVNAAGIRWAHLGAYGEVEEVEMVALGDFWGEEAEELWGENLAEQVVAWLKDTSESH